MAEPAFVALKKRVMLKCDTVTFTDVVFAAPTEDAEEDVEEVVEDDESSSAQGAREKNDEVSLFSISAAFNVACTTRRVRT